MPVFSGPIGPAVDLADLADRAVADQLDDPPRAVKGVPLIAHLRDDIHLAGDFAHPPRLVNRMRERLLAIDVLAHPHGQHAGRGVVMVGSRDDDRVDVLALFEHLAVIFVLGNVRIFLVRFGRALVVGVAQCDDVLVRATGDINAAFSAGADRGDVELLVRRAAGRPNGRSRDPDHRTQCGRLFHEITSRRLSDHVAPCALGLRSSSPGTVSIMPRRPARSQPRRSRFTSLDRILKLHSPNLPWP